MTDLKAFFAVAALFATRLTCDATSRTRLALLELVVAELRDTVAALFGSEFIEAAKHTVSVFALLACDELMFRSVWRDLTAR